MLPLPDSGIRGLKSFDAQLMLDEHGAETLIANDVFRLYFGYVSACRTRGDQPLPFGAWISPERIASQATSGEEAPSSHAMREPVAGEDVGLSC